MYAIIESEEIRLTEREEFLRRTDTISIFKQNEWDEERDLRQMWGIQYENPMINCCKIENHLGYLYATLQIPQKAENDVKRAIAFYLLPEKIIFIDNGNTVREQLDKITENKLRTGYTLERFLYDFLTSFFEDDLLYLQEMEAKIAEIEESVLKECCTDFNKKMLVIKKKISRFYRYYTQLAEIGQELLDNEQDFFEKDDLRMFDRFRDRAARHAQEAQIMREYAMQVQDVYQSEIGIHQNDVMKVLTVVTTIFLPLTLIAGWYGMNFTNMPELTWKYGYAVIIGVSILVVIFCLILFKKKKFW